MDVSRFSKIKFRSFLDKTVDISKREAAFGFERDSTGFVLLYLFL
jgi:hypothetical protein